MEATPSRNVEKSDWESQSGDSKDNETASDDFRCLKVVAVAATAGITYDFGASGIVKACIGSMENYTHYFLMGYGRAPGAELVLEPRANKAIVFEDFLLLGFAYHPI
jgi:hypothetical protein